MAAITSFYSFFQSDEEMEVPRIPVVFLNEAETNTVRRVLSESAQEAIILHANVGPVTKKVTPPHDGKAVSKLFWKTKKNFKD